METFQLTVADIETIVKLIGNILVTETFMPVLIRDSHLEQQIEREKLRRGDGTMAKTLGDLARERLMELERDGVYETVAADRAADSKSPVA